MFSVVFKAHSLTVKCVNVKNNQFLDALITGDEFPFFVFQRTLTRLFCKEAIERISKNTEEIFAGVFFHF